ncbi:MAG: DUF3857 domain-containing protein [Chitinophagaceae bacterium]|nr:DUF3857 domain-containing protein [Chitinophagaceae bacterium]
MKRVLFVLLVCVWIPAVKGFSQPGSGARFGKITPEDFNTVSSSSSLQDGAIIIADIGSTQIEGNSKGNFSLEFKNYRRAQVLNKNGYDIGNVSISIFTDGNADEELISLKAVTYNLENGKVVETKLETKSAVYTDRINKNWVIEKFTFPNVKEGSILEYQYTLKSDHIFNLRPWQFQGEYPRLWSEYKVGIPEFLYYVTLSQGYLPFFIKDQKSRAAAFTVSDNQGVGGSERINLSASVTEYRWAMRDVPALKEESFTSTIGNHMAQIEFQLAEQRYPMNPKNIMGNWTQACASLLEKENFGLTLDNDSPWLEEAVNDITAGTRNELDRAKKIFAYLRDHVTCTENNRTNMDQSLKLVWKNKRGNEAEINLLLIAMLRKAGVGYADPVLLSKRSHGYVYSSYPLLDRFNYVIARLDVGGHTYYLDASTPRLGFGRLDYECYNGHARIVNADATAIELAPDSLLEKSITTVFLLPDGNGNFAGNMQWMPGYYESYRLRSLVSESGKEAMTNEMKRGFENPSVAIRNLHVDSLEHFADPLYIRYNFEIPQDKQDIIYLNPMFGVRMKENPFKAAARSYPVEMPYTIDETYILQLAIPEGYVTDELPKEVMLKLNEDDDGMFEYRIQESGGTISLRSRLRIRRTYFQPEEYQMLREFFNLVVKQHNEQIVFKKKN